MARWVDRPDWRDGTAALLHGTLANSIYQVSQMTEIWQRIGMSPAHIVWHDQTAAALWPALTRDASDAGNLEALIRLIRAEKPSIAPVLDQVLAVQVARTNWYQCPEPHRSMLVGPGAKRAVLDRTQLRTSLLRMVTEDYPILSIVGRAGSGKTYSRHLIQHIVGSDPFVRIDIEGMYDRVTAADLVRTLALRLGIIKKNDDITVDPHVEASRAAWELVHQFVGLYRALPPVTRWVFIDGLDRTSVEPSVHTAVAQIAKEVEAGQLRDMRLIVTGHSGDFAPDVHFVLLSESLADITEHDLRQFFQHVADIVGHPLSGLELTALVEKAVSEAGLADLKALGHKAGTLAHESFGPREGMS
ncbi:MAG TPA: hypothetical protein VF821_06820 [Lentzea sp.]